MSSSPESGVDPTTLMCVVPDSRFVTGESAMSERQNIATGCVGQAENMLLADVNFPAFDLMNLI